MRISAAGLELVKSFEGFRETATRLPDGRWTIGYGHVRTAREGLTISQKDAEDLLLYDLKPVEDAVGLLVYAPLMQNQFDALVSLAFNISTGQFRDSEILRNLNAGDFLAAANGFDRWRKARIHGQVMIVDALVRRRAAEKGLFLEHPSGRPSAPTPLVKPEIDAAPEAAAQPRARDADDEETPRNGPELSGDIAEAVRRLAERTREVITPMPEISPPPSALVAAPEATVRAPVIEPMIEEPPVEEPAQPKTAEEIEQARRVVAERVARILERAEKEIDTQEEAAKPVASPTQPKPAAKQHEVREGLPDFDQPAERVVTPRARPRAVIDDTEIIEPGRDPAVLFAEAERKAKIVNGHSRRIGPISGRLTMLAPWIIVLALSILGLIIGAVDTFKTSDSFDASVPRAAATLLAVFGVMMLMSVYFIFWNRTSDEN